MADIKSLKDLGIPLRIDGATRFVKGATKYTTCSDVIKMVLKKTGIGKGYRHMFAIFEITKQGESLVPNGNRIIKVMESWGTEPNKFVLRKTDPLSQEQIPTESRGKIFKKTSNKKQNTTVNSNYNNVMKLAEIISKHNKKIEIHQQKQLSSAAATESSDSDSSLEDFISQMDESKVAYLMNAFQAAITSKSQRKADVVAKKTSPRTKASKVKKLLRRPVNEKKKECSKRRTYKKTTSASDVHPNKMYGVQRVNYGFVDTFPEDEPDDEFIPTATALDKTFVKHCGPTRMHELRRQTICAPLSPSNELSDSDSPLEVFRRNEKFRRATRCREDRINKNHGSYLEDSSSSSESDDKISDAALSRCNRRRRMYGRRLRYFDVNKAGENNAITNAQQKLVDYSITDDELSEDDTKVIIKSNISGSMSDIYDSVSDTTDSLTSRSTLNSYTSKSSHCSRSSDKNSDAGYCTDIVGHENDADEKVFRPASRVCNNNVSDFIRELFSKKTDCLSEDEEMDSFMRSRIADDFSDDGLSSAEADSNKCR